MFRRRYGIFKKLLIIGLIFSLGYTLISSFKLVFNLDTPQHNTHKAERDVEDSVEKEVKFPNREPLQPPQEDMLNEQIEVEDEGLNKNLVRQVVIKNEKKIKDKWVDTNKIGGDAAEDDRSSESDEQMQIKVPVVKEAPGRKGLWINV